MEKDFEDADAALWAESPAGTSAAPVGPASEDRQAVSMLESTIYRVTCHSCGHSEIVNSSRQGVDWARAHYEETGHLVEGIGPLRLASDGPPAVEEMSQIESIESAVALLLAKVDDIERDVGLVLALHRALAQGLVELGKLGPLKMISGLGSLGAVLREVDHAGTGGGGPAGERTAGVVEADSQGYGGRDPGPAGGIGGS